MLELMPSVQNVGDVVPSPGPVRFYTVPQVAAMTQLSKDRVYEIIRQRILPAIHIGRQIRIAEAALLAWVQASSSNR